MREADLESPDLDGYIEQINITELLKGAAISGAKKFKEGKLTL